MISNKPLILIVKKLSPKVLVLLISSLLSVLFLEICLRTFKPQKLESPINIYENDSKLGWKLKPNLNRKLVNPEWEMVVKTNEKGFRDKNHDYEKPDNVYRILGIGDSFLFGYGTNFDDNVMSVLNKKFNGNETIKHEVQTINLGVPRYAITEYYRSLVLEGRQYEPDLVITFFFMNDFQMDSTHIDANIVNIDGFITTIETFSLRTPRSALLHLRVFLKQNSHLYIFLRERLTTTLQMLKLRPLPNPLDHFHKSVNIREKYSYTLNVIDKLNQYCKKHNYGFLLCVIPSKLQVVEAYRNRVVATYRIDESDYDWFNPQSYLRKFCIEKQINYFDLASVFKNARKDEPHYFEIDMHWNEKGHELAAEAIYEYLRGQNLRLESLN